MLQKDDDYNITLQSDKIIPVRITIKIVKNRNPYLVIANLATHFGVEVNTISALSVREKQSSWFKLELMGTRKQIDSALIYLSALEISLS